MCVSCSVASNSLWPYGLWPTRLPLSMEFSGQEYWSELPFPSPDLPYPGIELWSPALQVESLPSEPQESEIKSHSVVSDSLRPHGLRSPQNSPGQSTGVGGLSLLQGIFSAQGWNPGLLHCRRMLHQLSHRAAHLITHTKHRPRWYSGKECTCLGRRRRSCGLDPWVRKTPWRRQWQPSPVFLPRKSQGQRSQVPYSPRVCKESYMTEWLTHTHAALCSCQISQNCTIKSVKYQRTLQ